MPSSKIAVARDPGTLGSVTRRCFLLALGLAGLGALAMVATNLMNNAHAQAAPQQAEERITFGGGCFWCLEAVFQRLKGVKQVVSGYAGGGVANPTYEAVCSGETGHAEVVQLTFNSAEVSFEKLLEVFWAAHDPTSVLDKDTFIRGKLYPKGTAFQGADIGSQYRSIILYENEAQKLAAEKSKTEAQKDFKKPIATEIVGLKTFYPAEGYHQNYYNQNKNRNPYCSMVITPKLQKLLKERLIAEEPVLR
jgi:peptide-methionine (S)-S-oxide reductase